MEEFRAQQTEETPSAPVSPEPLPLTLEPEEEGVLTGELSAEEAFPELSPEEPSPEEVPELSEGPELPPEGPEIHEDAAAAPEDGPEAPATPSKSRVPTELLEGFDDQDDFYAGYIEERDTAPQEEEQEEGQFGDPALGIDGEEPKPEKKTAPRRARGQRRGPSRNPVAGFRGWLVGLLAVSSMRREQNKTQPPPEPEDVELEMEPRKAAKHYASQMPSLRLRTIGAGVMCLLLIWLTLSCGFGWPLPGDLDLKLRAVSLICLAGELTVMLLGLDIVTSGVMSLLRGRPGAESMIVLAGLASALDTVVIVVSKNTGRGLPFCVIPAAAVVFALWGSWFTGRGYYDSFMTFFHVQEEPYAVTSRELPDMEERGLITVHRPVRGFIRRSEEPSLSESLAASAFVPMAAASLALSLALAIGSGDTGAFFHIFALMTGLCTSFGWLFAFPLLFAKTARHLQMNGSALAGWVGAREIGKSRQLVLNDTDIFPEDTMEITGIRIVNKNNVEKTISYTGSMLATAGTGSAAVFTELMRRHNAALQQVEDFSVGEGGAKGFINGVEVRVGTAGYMHLSGVKIPDKLKADTAVYTAIGGDLEGSFIYRYRPTAGVQRALHSLRRSRRKPIFAVRDFNLDAMLLRRSFGVSTEGFRFPPFPDRYRLSAVPENEGGFAAGITGQPGLEALTDLYESGMSLYLMGQVCAWVCVIGAVLGAVLLIAPCWLGNWGFASAARVLLYMLLWVLPSVVGAAFLRK